MQRQFQQHLSPNLPYLRPTMRIQSPLLEDNCDISDLLMNALCMKYGAVSSLNDNVLLRATSEFVRENQNYYEFNKRVPKRDIERAKIEVQKQYESALKAIRDRRVELLAAKSLLNENKPIQ
ncbi:hypothetical protein RB195_003680 [Necator americanus]|uniref:Uncharacterized protein n=1 Tax=Necator americanus TaxID=51031 RepID=A0ABR1DQZ6_NECAM